MIKHRPNLIVALDNFEYDEVQSVISDLKAAEIKWLKVGLELYTKVGPKIIHEFTEQGFDVFLDLKLHDIPNTVAKAVSAASKTGAKLLTVHALGGFEMLSEAQKIANESAISLLAVTVLTSYSDRNLVHLSTIFNGTIFDRSIIAEKLAKVAAEAGLNGTVCSVADLKNSKIKSFFPIKDNQHPLFVTPGIRDLNDFLDDQRSVASVKDAVEAGATHLVVGRPILQPKDKNRIQAAKKFLLEIEKNYAV